MSTSTTARERLHDALAALAEEAAERERIEEIERDERDHQSNKTWPRERRFNTD